MVFKRMNARKTLSDSSTVAKASGVSTGAAKHKFSTFFTAQATLKQNYLFSFYI